MRRCGFGFSTRRHCAAVAEVSGAEIFLSFLDEGRRPPPAPESGSVIEACAGRQWACGRTPRRSWQVYPFVIYVHPCSPTLSVRRYSVPGAFTTRHTPGPRPIARCFNRRCRCHGSLGETRCECRLRTHSVCACIESRPRAASSLPTVAAGDPAHGKEEERDFFALGPVVFEHPQVKAPPRRGGSGRRGALNLGHSCWANDGSFFFSFPTLGLAQNLHGFRRASVMGRYACGVRGTARRKRRPSVVVKFPGLHQPRRRLPRNISHAPCMHTGKVHAAIPA